MLHLSRRPSEKATKKLAFANMQPKQMDDRGNEAQGKEKRMARIHTAKEQEKRGEKVAERTIPRTKGRRRTRQDEA